MVFQCLSHLHQMAVGGGISHPSTHPDVLHQPRPSSTGEAVGRGGGEPPKVFINVS